MIAAIIKLNGRSRKSVMQPIYGSGSGHYYGAKAYNAPRSIGRLIIEVGNIWDMQLDKKRKIFKVIANVDYEKQVVHRAFRLPRVKPGSIALFAGPNNQHKQYRKHIVNE